MSSNLSRREFLKSAGTAAIVAGTLSTSLAQGDRKITLALVGAAHIHTPGFIDLLKTRNDVRVKSVWDHDSARAAQRAKELNAEVVSVADRLCGYLDEIATRPPSGGTGPSLFDALYAKLCEVHRRTDRLTGETLAQLFLALEQLRGRRADLGPTMCHGDLTLENLIVDERGAFCLLDFLDAPRTLARFLDHPVAAAVGDQRVRGLEAWWKRLDGASFERELASFLRERGFDVNPDSPKYRGISPRNVVNLPSGHGVQLEISTELASKLYTGKPFLRRAAINTTPCFHQIVAAVRQALAAHLDPAGPAASSSLAGYSCLNSCTLLLCWVRIAIRRQSQHLALMAAEQPADDVEEGRLAAAARPDQRDDLAVAHAEAEV
jgi:hypothetical protein